MDYLLYSYTKELLLFLVYDFPVVLDGGSMVKEVFNDRL